MTANNDNQASSLGRPPFIKGYELQSKLGQSGRSVVWKARQVLLGRMVAIKVLTEQQTNDVEEISRFKREALVAAGLKHPGIVQVFDFGQLPDSIGYYIVMEFISGYSVGAWFRRKKRLDELSVLTIGFNVAEALMFAWEKARIVHCGIKPDNIMVDGDGTIKISDLGMARAAHAGGQFAAISSAANSTQDMLPYMSPEQIRAENELDCRADIFSLGACLYHIATGTLPFGAGSPHEVLRSQSLGRPEDPKKINPDLSVGTCELILKMLARQPENRYPNWQEVRDVLVRQEKTVVAAGPVKDIMVSGATADKNAVDAKSADTTGIGGIPLRHMGYNLEQMAEAAGIPPPSWADFKECPYCAEPVRKKAIYCRFCGKDLPVKTDVSAAASAVGAKKFKTKLSKPQSASVVKPKASVPGAVAGEVNQDIMARLEKQQAAEHVKGRITMVLSLLLTAFIIYYCYQRFAKGNDIFIPVRTFINSGWKKINAKPFPARNAYQYSPAYAVPEREITLEPSRNKPPPVKEEDDEWQMDGWQGMETDVEEGIVILKPDVQEPPEAPLLPPLSVTETKSIREDTDFQALLKECEQKRPVVGQKVTLRLKNAKDPIIGNILDYQSDKIIVEIDKGKLGVPFRLMEPKTRLQFFPEDHALFLYRGTKAAL